MKLIALIALNPAVLLRSPYLPQSAPLLFALAMLDLVLVQSVILGRPLRAFHDTFLVVGLVASIALTVFAYFNAPPDKIGSLRILETGVGAYRKITGTPPWNRRSLEYLAIAERCVTSTLGVLLAWAAGLWVARRVKRRPPRPDSPVRRVASFFQGALIGLGVFTAIAFMVDYLVPGPPAPHTPGPHVRWLGSAICALAGGTAVLLLKSRRDPEEPVNRLERCSLSVYYGMAMPGVSLASRRAGRASRGSAQLDRDTAPPVPWPASSGSTRSSLWRARD
jgi:hypothetical protein